jgi:hypothetical protein
MASKLSKDDIDYLLHHDETFVNSKRFGYSIDAVVERYPDGAPDNVICQLLELDQQTLDALYLQIVGSLRGHMRVSDEEIYEEFCYSPLSPEVS